MDNIKSVPDEKGETMQRFVRRLGGASCSSGRCPRGGRRHRLRGHSGQRRRSTRACSQRAVRSSTRRRAQCRANEAAVSWNQTDWPGPPALRARRARPGPRERRAPPGRRGPRGEGGHGPRERRCTGATGPAGGLNQVQKVQASGTANSSGFATVLVNCPAGTTLTGGGAEILGLWATRRAWARA